MIQCKIFNQVNKVLLVGLFKSINNDNIITEKTNRKGTKTIDANIELKFINCQMGITKNSRFLPANNLQLPFIDYHKTFNIIENDDYFTLIQYTNKSNGVVDNESYRHDELEYKELWIYDKTDINCLLFGSENLIPVNNQQLIDDFACDGFNIIYKINSKLGRNDLINDRLTLDKIKDLVIKYHSLDLFVSTKTFNVVANVSTNGYVIITFRV